MTAKDLKPPERKVWEYAHGLAYQISLGQLAAIGDLAGQCARSGARYLPEEQAAALDYLGQSYRISRSGEVSREGGGEEVPMKDKLLLLHYFLTARGTPLSGRLITYKELPDGLNYYPTFFKRAIQPVLARFGEAPEGLTEAAAALGGCPADYADTAVTIPAFKYVPVTFALWRGDAEFAPDGNIMFDSTIPDYLPAEDITIISEVIAWRLARH